MRLRRLTGAAGLLAAALALTGCNGERTAEVTGTVTVDGQPAPTGSSIAFVPADGMSSGGGATITDGKYTATEVPVGPARVRVTVPRFAPEKSSPRREGPGGQGQLVIGELPLVDRKGRTEWTYKVKSGRNEKNWDLKSRDR